MRRPVRSARVGSTCLTNLIVAPCGVHSRSDTSATALPIAARGHRPEVRLQVLRLGDDVDGAEQRVGDLAQLLDLPVGADAAASQTKWPVTSWIVRASWRGVSCMFCPSVSRIACRIELSWVANTLSASRSHLPIAVPPLADSFATACLASARVCVVRDLQAVPVRVDQLGLVGAGDHRERDAVAQRVDRRGGGLLGRRQLGARHVHRAGGVDDDHLGGRPAAGAACAVACAGAAGRGDRDDRVDLGGARRQVLVLVDLDREVRSLRS